MPKAGRIYVLHMACEVYSLYVCTATGLPKRIYYLLATDSFHNWQIKLQNIKKTTWIFVFFLLLLAIHYLLRLFRITILPINILIIIPLLMGSLCVALISLSQPCPFWTGETSLRSKSPQSMAQKRPITPNGMKNVLTGKQSHWVFL